MRSARADLDRVDAVIFDMDGVVTDTAAVHASAWKQLFDDYLSARSARTGEPFVPFDIDTDYRRFVDGKPRNDGVRSFLTSRGIELAEGEPAGPPDPETVVGLGERKNQAFLDRLARDGAQVYPSTVELIRQLRAEGIAVAVISASENMHGVLDAAGLAEPFDAYVDGVDAAELSLPGKPDPAVFLEAARQLGSAPNRAAVVEDSLAGVEAGRRGGFALVIGVDRTGHPEALLAAGADIVVGDLRELEVTSAEPMPISSTPISAVPAAVGAIDDIRALMGGRTPAVFLDYDGTLSPIVAHPSEAVLPPAARAALLELRDRVPLAIISGRDLVDVRALVGIDGIWYAGSHGFDLAGPDGERYRRAPGSARTLDAAESALRAEIDGVPGAWVERKAFALAVHVRQAPADRIREVRGAVEHVAARYPDLRMTGGKQVFELRPAQRWDKGRAVRRLLDVMDLDPRTWIPIYIGDDLTDEDAFHAIREDGIGIVVRGESDERGTWARYSLDDPSGVPLLLLRLIEAPSP